MDLCCVQKTHKYHTNTLLPSLLPLSSLSQGFTCTSSVRAKKGDRLLSLSEYLVLQWASALTPSTLSPTINPSTINPTEANSRSWKPLGTVCEHDLQGNRHLLQVKRLVTSSAHISRDDLRSTKKLSTKRL